MKEFRTELKIVPASSQIELAHGIITQGSCFADAIGERLVIHKLNTLVNPFGVIYNPQSIHKVLGYAIGNDPVATHTFVQHNEIFLNYDFHSQFSSTDRDELSARLVQAIESTHHFLKNAAWLVLTYGTAWVYRRKDTDEIVANCHKMPAATFSKALLTVEDIESSFAHFVAALKQFNPGVKLILTVSPVRHLKDTLELNAVSKSVLRLAVHRLSLTHDDVEYFPAYELMMDDLRDYRFYKADMLHPTEEAEDYIWEKFGERYFSPAVSDFVRQWKRILAAVQHKPFHEHTAAHQQFLRDVLQKLEALEGIVDVGDEISQIKKQLTKQT